MPLKKSQLYSSLWKSCDELRGGMDASQYKDYVLTLLFVKYVSDRHAGDAHADILVPEGGSFVDMVALKGRKDIGIGMNKVIGRLAEENELKGVIDVADFNDTDKLGKGQTMVDKLTNLVGIFQNPNLDFRNNRAEGDDLLGDAYEFLMRHFATESGKSKGQFYTPAEVSRILAQVIGVERADGRSRTIYDPTCGSGSLLIKAADEAPSGLTIYGQEMDVATMALCEMNMILHGYATAEIAPGGDSTLSHPYFTDGDRLKRFDYVVANPPFSSKSWMSGLKPDADLYGRFADGVPPVKNGDFAFLLHILGSLRSTGTGACILPHGVLFRGNAEAAIRRNLVRRGLIKGVIGLPANLFYGTGIPACIVVVDKAGAEARAGEEGGVFMIDASRGFAKDGPKNRLRQMDVHRIVDAFRRGEDAPKYARFVTNAEIERNGYNLNIPRYIDASPPEDLHDIEAHLRGGIPERDVELLAPYWGVAPSLRAALFRAGDRPGYVELAVPSAEVRGVIESHAEFTAFRETVRGHLRAWRGRAEPRLRGIAVGDSPKALIAELAEDLLAEFGPTPLVDAYDAYQALMTYWMETMQDDAFLVGSAGWVGASRLRELVKGEDGKSGEEADLTVGKRKLKADLIPPALIEAEFFARERTEADRLLAESETLAAEVEALAEEYGGEEGVLADALNDKGRLTKASAAALAKIFYRELEAPSDGSLRVNLLSEDFDAVREEAGIINHALKLTTREHDERRAAIASVKSLEEAVAARYGSLTNDEARTLVVERKWLASVEREIEDEITRVTSMLTGRVRELAGRYAEPLPEIEARAEKLITQVEGHLARMGFTWM